MYLGCNTGIVTVKYSSLYVFGTKYVFGDVSLRYLAISRICIVVFCDVSRFHTNCFLQNSYTNKIIGQQIVNKLYKNKPPNAHDHKQAS